MTKMNKENVTVLGVDPGYERIGIAVVKEVEGAKKTTVMYSDCFITSKDDTLNERIFQIGGEIEKVIKKYSPTHLSIEKLYFTNNQKTAMGVAEARGVIINQAKHAGLTVREFTPLQVKVAVTGYGKADKKALWYMVKVLTEMSKEAKYDDEMDAIAIALTAIATKGE